jgi:hypothetical protein
VLVSAFEGSVIYFNALSCNALPDQTRRTLTEVVADNESLEPQVAPHCLKASAIGRHAVTAT